MKRKPLKFLVDVGVGIKVEQWLRTRGYDFKSIREINPGMTDKEILKIAVSEKLMIITMDKDFGELVYNSNLSHAGVLLLRLEDATSEEKEKAIEGILREHSAKILNKFCVYKSGRLRIKK